jgi:hypothetical protein
MAGKVTVVASRPFLKDDKWCVLSGDNFRYRIFEFPDQRAALREFRAIENSVLLECGFPCRDFYLLDVRDATKVVDLISYRLAIGRLIDRTK